MSDLAVVAAMRFALDVAFKATLLLAFAQVLLLFLRRAPAALRHGVSILALAGAVALPALTLLLPRWEVPLVPSILPDLQQAMPRRPIVWMQWMLGLWAAGASLSFARLLSASARVRAAARDAVRIWDLDWALLQHHLAARLGLRRNVTLLASDRVPVAMTWGARRPVLLLARGADRWPVERRRVVLLHELAHVERKDWIALLVAELARALYWFHPLAWLAARQARKDCEKACDDIVLASGTKPSVYAAHLLGVVRSLQASRQRVLPAVPMARPSQFEGRVRAILDPVRDRRRLSPAEKSLGAAGVLGVVLALAAIEPWAECPQRRAAAGNRAEPAHICAFPAAAASSRTESVSQKVTRCIRRGVARATDRPAARGHEAAHRVDSCPAASPSRRPAQSQASRPPDRARSCSSDSLTPIASRNRTATSGAS